MVFLKCSHKICGHKWNYTGRGPFRVCCPSCGYPFHLVKKNLVNPVADWPKLQARIGLYLKERKNEN